MKSRGFSAVEAIVIVAVVALVGALGYAAWNTAFNRPAASQTITSESRAATPVNSKEDLTSVEKDLDAVDVSDTEATEAEAEASV